MADDSEEDLEYKDHYKQILKDMISRRDKGFLETEEAVEGFVSASQSPAEGHTTHSSSTTNCHGSQMMTSNVDDVRTTFPRRFASFDDIFDDPTPNSDSQLVQNRSSPEGDQALMRADCYPEGSPDPPVTPQVTPEPSLIQVTNSTVPHGTYPPSDQNVPSVNEDVKTRKKLWNLMRGTKLTLPPK